MEECMTATEEQELRTVMGCAEGQSLLDRAKHFTNVDKFVPVEKLILAMVKTDKGVATCIGEFARTDMEIALTRMNYKVNQAFQMMDMAYLREQANEKRIVTPDSGIGRNN